MEHGLITQVAKAAGFPVQTVWNYCKGNYRPKMERAKVLERATGIDKLIWLEGDPIAIQKALASSPLAQQ